MKYENIVKQQISTTAQNLSTQKHDITTHHSLEVLEALVKPETPERRMEELDKEDKTERFKALVDIANSQDLVNNKISDTF